MKYYTFEPHEEKEAPFGVAWRVKLFDGHTLSNEYEHIFYNEITGYCKCLEDMGFIEGETSVLKKCDKNISKELHDMVKMFLADNEDEIRQAWYELNGEYPTE